MGNAKVFPGGVTEFTPDSVWYAGVANGLIFTLLILWLNIDNGARMFALSYHVWFWMTFMNPASNTFNSAFSLALTGPAVSSLLSSLCGVAMNA